MAGVAFGGFGYLLGRAFGHDLAAGVAAFRAHVNNMIGVFNNVQVVLDDYHAVAGVNQSVQDVQQLIDVCHVQAGGRLVQNIQCAAGWPADQFAGQFDALGFAAGQRCGRLAQS